MATLRKDLKASPYLLSVLNNNGRPQTLNPSLASRSVITAKTLPNLSNNAFTLSQINGGIIPRTQNQTLPNGGGTYNPAGTSAINPSPIFTGIKPTAQKAPQRNFYKNGGSYFYSDTNQKILDPNELGVASRSGVEVAPPAGAGTQDSFYDKYKDPKTGKVMTPEEWGVYLGNKVPKGNGEITNYAGDAMANPDKTAEELTRDATNLNNSRNDIATGTTDPYKMASLSGIPYSGAELKAIENAYAGIYDPALNDVFSRLDAKQAADKAEMDAKNAEAKAVQDQKDALERLAIQHGYSMELKRTPGATSGGGAGAGTLGILRGADGYVNPDEYVRKAYEYEASGKTMDSFINKFPPENYINPAGQAALPAFLQPKADTLSATEIDATIWKELGKPENAGLSDEDKAAWIKSQGRNPENFGVYGI